MNKLRAFSRVFVVAAVVMVGNVFGSTAPKDASAGSRNTSAAPSLSQRSFYGLQGGRVFAVNAVGNISKKHDLTGYKAVFAKTATSTGLRTINGCIDAKMRNKSIDFTRTARSAGIYFSVDGVTRLATGAAADYGVSAKALVAKIKGKLPVAVGDFLEEAAPYAEEALLELMAEEITGRVNNFKMPSSSSLKGDGSE
jgi:hypothetical protein